MLEGAVGSYSTWMTHLFGRTHWVALSYRWSSLKWHKVVLEKEIISHPNINMYLRKPFHAWNLSQASDVPQFYATIVCFDY